jgi:membrane-associated PAP2 superfamily phosphatase
MNGNLAILATGLLLVLVVALFDLTRLDLWVQDRFYYPARGWLVDPDARVPKLVFYDAPKVVFALIFVFLVACIVAPALGAFQLPLSRREAAFLLVCIVVVPVTAYLGKKTTGVFYPSRIERYGGKQPYRTLLQSIPRVPGRERGRGFPAAHCSGAFALMALYFVLPGEARWLGLACGLAAGWSVGIYQMLKGAHYLSHTVVTMVVAWLIILVASRAFGFVA